jgi:hypothetical protein
MPISPTYGQFAYPELPYVMNCTILAERLQLSVMSVCATPVFERRISSSQGCACPHNIVDTKPNPREPRLVKIIEPEEVKARADTAASIRCTVGRLVSTLAP